MDFEALHADASTDGRKRVDRDEPANSLILQKPTLQVDHEGDERFQPGSWEHHLLKRWIEAGAKGTPNPQSLSHVEIEPAEVVFDAQASADEPVQVRVIAVWEDQHREDVTPLCRFRSNDDSIVTVDREGRLSLVGVGDTHVIAFYDNGVASVPVMRPFDGPQSESVEIDTGKPGIDSFVLEKLNKLRIVPSALCADAEFLRRASIDLTGTLPPPSEIEAFLADDSRDKRLRSFAAFLTPWPIMDWPRAT